MLRSDTVVKKYLNTYKIYEVDGMEERLVGLNHSEDGVEVTVERTLNDVPDGIFGGVEDIIETDRKVTVKVTLTAWGNADLETALPGCNIETYGDNMKLTIKAGQILLKDYAKTYVLKPANDENNVNEYITLHKAVNIENLVLTFKVGEVVSIPLTLQCFKNVNNEYVTLGDVDVTE
jgi:hypothetical protein